MKSTAEVSHRLLECLLSEGEHSECWEIVKLLMIKYGLLVPLRREEGKETADLKYLVPALLPELTLLSEPALLSEVAYDDSDIAKIHRPFYFHFTLSGSSDDCLLYDDMKEGFLPGGLFVRLIGKVLGWSQDTTHSNAKTWTCHKHWMTVFFGRQKFRLTYLVDYNAIQVDILDNGTPIGIHARLRNILDKLIKAHFKSLNMITLLEYHGEGLSRGPSIRPTSALRQKKLLLIPLTPIRTAMTKHVELYFGKNHPPGKELMTADEVDKQYGSWQLQTMGKTFDVFVSYRQGEHASSPFAGKFSILIICRIRRISSSEHIFLA